MHYHSDKETEAGHEIGNHTYSHDRMIFKSPSLVDPSWG
ncbi:polysaccharide deacetylase family protein [Paenibacillus aurantiacus]|uniref:Polysaccharide deacetylase family protein n=1 Tax=Paenibacillus aurantiacus TaxID=1936118 RepID=A0ABV5KM49_9BACL